MTETESIGVRLLRALSLSRRKSTGRPHPARALFLGFAIAILAGTGVLMLPIATESGDSTPFIAALFTATSAICVTGLTVLDTRSIGPRSASSRSSRWSRSAGSAS